ncbi:hypothetical protein RRG08_008986 [Elysia crispata]|uniref:Uncharacterized protein n=1 Tax=Elysia crispata TaxID=231223 RepID=A0AAE1ATG9_9GAST|nr:hypothetical protein RRG08_008986 [Elysia crispata]
MRLCADAIHREQSSLTKAQFKTPSCWEVDSSAVQSSVLLTDCKLQVWWSGQHGQQLRVHRLKTGFGPGFELINVGSAKIITSCEHLSSSNESSLVHIVHHNLMV